MADGRKTLGAYIGETSASNRKYPNAADVAGGPLNWTPHQQEALEPCEVTQADREAAAAFYGPHLSRPGEVLVTAHMRAGKIDESPLIQAFARHRIAALNHRPTDNAQVREAIQEACDLLAERVQGSPARSASHNARLRMERALRLLDAPAALQPTPDVREAALEEAAKVAEAHEPDRIKKGESLGRFDPEDREIIRAEENGEAVAASVIATAIRALKSPQPDNDGEGVK